MPPKTKTNEQNTKLEELIERLEDRLSFFNENELKQRCSKILVGIHKNMETLETLHEKLYKLLGFTFSDIHYAEDEHIGLKT